MPNPVRPWEIFLTAWEKFDLNEHKSYITKCHRTLTKLRAWRKDIDARIKYWEDNLEKSQILARETETRARGRERYERIALEAGKLPGEHARKPKSKAN